MNNQKQSAITVIVCLLIAVIPTYAQWSDWVAPKNETDTLINIYQPGDTAAISGAQVLYSGMCFLCHGDHGQGDGVQAPALARPPADLTSTLVQQQTDGELFWKITNGNDLMLNFSYYTVEQRWQLVTYIRELAKLYPPEPVVEEELDAELNSNASGQKISWQLAILGTVVVVIMAILFYTIYLMITALRILREKVD